MRPTPREITLRDVPDDELVRQHFRGTTPASLLGLANWIMEEPDRWRKIKLYRCPCARLHGGICADRWWVEYLVSPHETRAMAALLRVLSWRLRVPIETTPDNRDSSSPAPPGEGAGELRSPPACVPGEAGQRPGRAAEQAQ